MPEADDPLVTVLLPVYQPDERYLTEAIQSILAQTHTNFELVIVEDPSPQMADKTIARFGDSRIRHIVNPVRTSFIEQLNRGIHESKGELIARMDGDDIAEPERLAAQVAAFQREPGLSVVGTQLKIMDESGTHLGFRRYPRGHDAIYATMRRFCPFAHPSVMYRKSVILQVGGYQHPELHPAEDYDLWSRLALAGARFDNLEQPLLRYRLHLKAAKVRRLRDSLRHTIHVKRTYWRKDMSIRDRLRLFSERALMWMPAFVVMWLFRRTQIQTNI